MIKRLFRNIKFLLLRLLRINDSAHGIAIGFTLGALINFVPSFGVGPILSAFCAKLFKGNPFAGFVGGVAFLWAFPLLFYLNIVVGETLLAIQITDLHHMNDLIEGGYLVWKAFIVGMLINLLLFGSIIYSVIYYFMKKYRYDILMFIYKRWKI